MRFGVQPSSLGALASAGPAARERLARVAVVIPVHGSRDYLERCLADLERTTAAGDVRVVIVDDASDRQTREYVQSLAGRHTVVCNETNLGFAATCNRGAEACEEPLLLFLNSDMALPAGWLEPLIEALDGDPKIGAVSPKLLYPDGSVQCAGVFTLEDHINRTRVAASGNHVGLPGEHLAANQPGDLECATAAALLVRREAFEQAGRFDEGYYNGYEDVELCLSLRAAGWRIAYRPDVALIHHESKSGPKRWLKVRQNVARLDSNWGGRYTPQALVTPYAQVMPHPGRSGRFVPELEPCSVVVLAQDELSDLPDFLNSLMPTLGPQDRLQIVDMAGNDGTSNLLGIYEGRDARLSILRPPAGVSESEALNAWLAGCTTEDVAIVRPQARFCPGWLSRMQVHLRHGDVGIVGCHWVPPIGGWESQALQAGRDHAGLAVSGSHVEGPCVLTKRSVLDNIGGFELASTLDFDLLSRSIRTSGYEALCARDVLLARANPELAQELAA